MPNPADFFTQEDFDRLGLSPEEIRDSYHPSSGGVYHAKGTESQGKSLLIAHIYRDLIDKGKYLPSEATGNMSFRGKYANGYTVRKGKELHQYLWELTHTPLRHKIVIVDEIDSEFPARFFASHEQTEIALRMWHTAKLGNTILMSSHLGRGADLIFDLATHYGLYPEGVNWEDQSLDYTVIDTLLRTVETDWVAHDVVRTMLIYDRQEITENTLEDMEKEMPEATKKISNSLSIERKRSDPFVERVLPPLSFQEMRKGR